MSSWAVAVKRDMMLVIIGLDVGNQIIKSLKSFKITNKTRT